MNHPLSLTLPSSDRGQPSGIFSQWAATRRDRLQAVGAHASVADRIVEALGGNEAARKRLGPHFQLLASLRPEADSSLFYSSLIRFGQILAGEDLTQEAMLVFSTVRESAPAELKEIRHRAEQEGNALTGVGSSFGRRAEVIGRGFTQRFSLAMLIGMGGAHLVFGSARAFFLSKLLSSPSAGVMTRGLTARVFSYLGALALEAPALVGIQQGLYAALGKASDGISFGSELLNSYAPLAGLRLASLAGTALGQRIHGIHSLTGQATRLTGVSRISQSVLPSASALGGFYLGRELGTWVGGSRTPHSFADSLAMLAEFAVAGRILNRAFPGLARLNQRLHWQSEQLARSGGGMGDNLAKNFRLPGGPLGVQGALTSPSSNGAKVFGSESYSAQAPVVFMTGSASGKGSPKLSDYVAEIARLHRVWVEGEGRILLGGKIYQGEEVKNIDLHALQVAMWDPKQRPVDTGRGDLSQSLFGKLGPYLANLNNPAQLYGLRELGHAYYLLGLSILQGRYIDRVILPATAGVTVPKYTDSYFDLLHEKRGGKGPIQPDLSPSPQAMAEPKNVWSVSLADVRGVIPPGGGAPMQNRGLTAAVSRRVEELLEEGKVLGWWHGGQANLMWSVPEFSSPDVFSLLRQRPLWSQWFPGFYLVKHHYGDPVGGEALFEIAVRTPLATIHMLTMHSENERGMQMQWRSPTEAQTKGNKLQLDKGETGVEDIKGSLTVAPTPTGKGALVIYGVAIKLVQRETPGAVIRIQDLSRDETVRDQAFLSRGPFVAESLLQVLRNPDWGIKDPKDLEAHQPNTLKGPIEGKRTYDRLFVNLKE